MNLMMYIQLIKARAEFPPAPDTFHRGNIIRVLPTGPRTLGGTRQTH